MNRPIEMRKSHVPSVSNARASRVQSDVKYSGTRETRNTKRRLDSTVKRFQGAISDRSIDVWVPAKRLLRSRVCIPKSF